MKQPILSYNDLSKYNFMEFVGHVVHALCLSGSMSFLLNDIRYNVTSGDFVIFVNGVIAWDG